MDNSFHDVLENLLYQYTVPLQQPGELEGLDVSLFSAAVSKQDRDLLPRMSEEVLTLVVHRHHSILDCHGQ
jgi:hypothetical protein